MKYLIVFLVSMVPIVELRGALPIAAGFGLPMVRSYIICVIGNMLPVPVIFFFARTILVLLLSFKAPKRPEKKIKTLPKHS